MMGTDFDFTEGDRGMAGGEGDPGVAPEGGLDGLDDLAASMDEAAADRPLPDDMPEGPGLEPMPGGEGAVPPPEGVDDVEA
jgi:hypothetical protein